MEPGYNIIQYSFTVRRGAIAGFRGGSRRPSLLIVDRSGVYSTARRCYIRKSRHYRYRAMAIHLAPLVKAYRSLQKLGMNSWPEYDEGARKEITRWKHKVMDAYWDAAPEKRKARATERYFRARYKHGILYPLLACVVSVVVGAGLLHLMRFGRFMVGFDVWLLQLALCFLSWSVVVTTEQLVTDKWTLSRSQIYNVLEFELRS